MDEYLEDEGDESCRTAIGDTVDVVDAVCGIVDSTTAQLDSAPLPPPRNDDQEAGANARPNRRKRGNGNKKKKEIIVIEDSPPRPEVDDIQLIGESGVDLGRKRKGSPRVSRGRGEMRWKGDGDIFAPLESDSLTSTCGSNLDGGNSRSPERGVMSVSGGRSPPHSGDNNAPSSNWNSEESGSTMGREESGRSPPPAFAVPAVPSRDDRGANSGSPPRTGGNTPPPLFAVPIVPSRDDRGVNSRSPPRTGGNTPPPLFAVPIVPSRDDRAVNSGSPSRGNNTPPPLFAVPIVPAQKTISPVRGGGGSNGNSSRSLPRSRWDSDDEEVERRNDRRDDRGVNSRSSHSPHRSQWGRDERGVDRREQRGGSGSAVSSRSPPRRDRRSSMGDRGGGGSNRRDERDRSRSPRRDRRFSTGDGTDERVDWALERKRDPRLARRVHNEVTASTAWRGGGSNRSRDRSRSPVHRRRSSRERRRDGRERSRSPFRPREQRGGRGDEGMPPPLFHVPSNEGGRRSPSPPNRQADRRGERGRGSPANDDYGRRGERRRSSSPRRGSEGRGSRGRSPVRDDYGRERRRSPSPRREREGRGSRGRSPRVDDYDRRRTPTPLRELRRGGRGRSPPINTRSPARERDTREEETDWSNRNSQRIAISLAEVFDGVERGEEEEEANNGEMKRKKTKSGGDGPSSTEDPLKKAAMALRAANAGAKSPSDSRTLCFELAHNSDYEAIIGHFESLKAVVTVPRCPTIGRAGICVVKFQSTDEASLAAHVNPHTVGDARIKVTYPGSILFTTDKAVTDLQKLSEEIGGEFGAVADICCKKKPGTVRFVAHKSAYDALQMAQLKSRSQEAVVRFKIIKGMVDKEWQPRDDVRWFDHRAKMHTARRIVETSEEDRGDWNDPTVIWQKTVDGFVTLVAGPIPKGKFERVKEYFANAFSASVDYVLQSDTDVDEPICVIIEAQPGTVAQILTKHEFTIDGCKVYVGLLSTIDITADSLGASARTLYRNLQSQFGPIVGFGVVEKKAIGEKKVCTYGVKFMHMHHAIAAAAKLASLKNQPLIPGKEHLLYGVVYRTIGN